MEEKLTVGSIGTGGLALMEAEILDDLDGVDVVAGADIAADAREAFAESVGGRTYEDFREMLAAEDLDAVNVCTPHALHYEQASVAIEAGCHVHVEKPMVTDTADGHALIAAAEDADVCLQVGYQRHFHPGYAELKRVLDSGRIGELHMVSCYLAQDWISGQAGEWRTNPDLSGGGQLFDSGQHLLDAMLWTTDTVPGDVAAVMDDREHDVDVNSALAVTLEGSERPITASVGVSADGVDFEEGIVIWGTEGRVEYAGGTLTVVENGQTYVSDIAGETDFSALTREKLAAFVDAVRGERDVAVTGADGLRVTALTEAAYEARETRTTVDAGEYL
jgi:predicted dehydrogenase